MHPRSRHNQVLAAIGPLAPDPRRLADVPVAVVDLEMTGLSVEHDRIVEIGLVRMVGGVVTDELDVLVNPGIPMTSEARRVTGIEDAHLAQAPTFAEVLPQLRPLLDGAILVGHRVELDHAFLNAAFAALGEPLIAPPVFDTLVMARNALALRSHNLHSLCEALGVTRDVAHRALPDARATAGVFQALVNVIAPVGGATVSEVADEVASLAAGSPRRAQNKSVLKAGLSARRTVWIDYIGRDEEHRPTLTHREIAVWGVDGPHCSAWCFLRGEHRMFRLDRIRTAQAGEQAYEIPVDRPPLKRRAGR